MKVIIILLLILLGAILHSKKFVNLNVIADGIMYIMVIGLMGTVFYAMYSFLPIITNNNVKFFIIFIFMALSIIIILLVKNIFGGIIRIIDYYIHNKAALKNGYIETGTIIDIKSEYNSPTDSRYWLVVDINGKIIKSTYFIDNIYSIGENIDVVSYKKHKYVVLRK